MTTPSLISLQEITRDLGTRKLFADLSLVIYSNDRVVLIGPNGAGKSSLLKIIAGDEGVDSGDVHQKSGVRITYIPQAEKFDGKCSVGQTIERYLEAKGFDESDVFRLSSVWLGRSGFEDFEQLVQNLSGGWKKRLALACGFASEPDLLLLDEPTNHLDITGIEWLEREIAGFRGAVVTVSHDRWFIEQVAKRVVEVNLCYPSGTFASEGGYGDLLERRVQYLESLQQMKDSLSNKVRREVEWLRAGVKARTTKSKSRIQRAHEMIDTLADIKLDQKKASLSFGATERKTKELIKLENVAYSIEGTKLFADLSVCIRPGDVLGIVGANGSGKTTLLSVILGNNKPESGKIKVAKGLRIGFFDQARKALAHDTTLKEALAPDSDSVIVKGVPIYVAAWADRFLFSHTQLSLPISSLSGGEQARALLAIIMAQELDVLVFDEPTNDLDIQTLEVFEKACQEFDGAVVLVTHDRYMLNRIATSIIGIADGQITHCADYRQWESIKLEKSDDIGQRAKKTKEVSKQIEKKKTKLSYMEQRELDGMEDAILVAEEALSQISEEIGLPENAANSKKLVELSTKLDSAREHVDRLYKRWEELEELRRGFGV